MTNKLIHWKLELLKTGFFGIGKFEDGRTFYMFIPMPITLCDGFDAQYLEQMIQKVIEKITPDMPGS